MTTATRRWLIGIGLVALWCVPGVLTELTLLLANTSSRLRIRSFMSVSGSILVWLAWAPLTPAIAALVRRWPVEREHLRKALAIHIPAAIAFALLSTLWYTAVAKVFAPQERLPRDFWLLFRLYLSPRGPFGLLLYAAIAGIVIALDERRRRRERELHAAQLEAALARAQLRTLQTQLQPHFLFNTLHAIGMLVHESPTDAARMVTHLGDLLRQTLSLADVAEVPLRDELGILRRYLDIEMARFPDRLTATIDAQAGVLDEPVPTFILQPVVENAVRHGIAPRPDAGHVSVRARRDGDALILEVEDDGPGFSSSPGTAGIGLATTRERLAMLYDGAARLTCGAGANGGARVTIALPAANV